MHVNKDMSTGHWGHCGYTTNNEGTTTDDGELLTKGNNDGHDGRTDDGLRWPTDHFDNLNTPDQWNDFTSAGCNSTSPSPNSPVTTYRGSIRIESPNTP